MGQQQAECVWHEYDVGVTEDNDFSIGNLQSRSECAQNSRALCEFDKTYFRSKLVSYFARAISAGIGNDDNGKSRSSIFSAGDGVS